MTMEVKFDEKLGLDGFVVLPVNPDDPNTMMAKVPAYRSHKVVAAVKIKELEHQEDGGALLWPELPKDFFAMAAFSVSPEWMTKHEARVGGYYVFYEDGYRSYSPAEAFENGYTRIEQEKD